MKIDVTKISLREFRESDIEEAVRYWTDPKEETIYSFVKEEIRGNAEIFRKTFQDFLLDSERQKFGRIIEYNGVTVGSINLTDVREGTAHLHGHFWNKEYRGKGLGLIAGAMVVKWLIEANNLKGLFICPPSLNPMSSRIPEKLGLTPLEIDVELPYPMIRAGVRGNIYYLSKEELFTIADKILETSC